MNDSPISALILAAGRSRRAGRDKLLARRPDGRTMIGAVVRTMLGARASGALADVAVVVNPEADALLAALPGAPLRRIVAPDAARGMAASLRSGIAGLPPDHAIMICLGDMPDLDPELPARLVDAYRGSGLAAPVVVPEHDGQLGHPVLWHPAHRPALLALDGDRGGRAVLETQAAMQLRLPAGAGILVDYDTPERLLMFERGEKSL